MRQFINIISEGISAAIPTGPAEQQASGYDNADDFIRSLDSTHLDVLYRGHSGGQVTGNSFMTDYIGHALSYAGDDIANVDAYLYDPQSVYFYNEMRFNDFKSHFRRMDDADLRSEFQASLNGNRFGADLADHVETVLQIIQGSDYGRDWNDDDFEEPDDDDDASMGEIFQDPSRMDPLIPLLQKYAADRFGANIIGFIGGDYDGAGQPEFVVRDVSRLVNLRELFARMKEDA